MPNMEPGIIPDIKMKYFTNHYLIPNYTTKIILSPIIHLLILNSKLVLLMELIPVHMHLVTKVIHIIHLGMKLSTEINLDTTLQLQRKIFHNQ